MHTYKTKFGIGDIVEAHGLPGMVTALHIRGGICYEFSYIHDGEPKSCNCEEVELKLCSKSKIGFQKGD